MGVGVFFAALSKNLFNSDLLLKSGQGKLYPRPRLPSFLENFGWDRLIDTGILATNDG